MGIDQLNIPFQVTTPFGEAVCHFAYDAGDETYWGCFQKETCELWWWSGPEIRYAIHLSEGFNKQTPIILSKERQAALAPHMKRYKNDPSR